MQGYVDIAKFISERNKALFSLNKDRIKAFAKKYNVTIPDNETAFWGAVYKAIYAITDAPPGLKGKAEKWLEAHNFSKEIG